MTRSLFAAIAICAALGCVSCSTLKGSGKGSGSGAADQSVPVVSIRTAALDITAGIKVLARVPLTGGFSIAADKSPAWVQEGREIAVIGTIEGHAAIFG